MENRRRCYPNDKGRRKVAGFSTRNVPCDTRAYHAAILHRCGLLLRFFYSFKHHVASSIRVLPGLAGAVVMVFAIRAAWRVRGTLSSIPIGAAA